MTAAADVVRDWVRASARPVSVRGPAGGSDLAPLHEVVAGATVVGFGVTSREAHEPAAFVGRALRHLVEELGFRALALEMGPAGAEPLDHHVRTGRGDPRELLSAPGIQPFWRIGEVVEVIAWMRAWAEAHPADPVRLVGIDDEGAEGLEAIERGLATNLIAWQERTGHRVAYWGGAAHVARGPSRSVPSPAGPRVTGRNGGSLLAARYGAAYVPVGLTFGHGAAPFTIPVPPPDRVEAVLGAVDHDMVLLDLRAPAHPEARAWLDAPARARLVGPRYDPADDAGHYMAGGSLAGWFDAVAHTRRVTPAHPLPPAT